jgi:mono/diheme cytochrome c family protein
MWKTRDGIGPVLPVLRKTARVNIHRDLMNVFNGSISMKFRLIIPVILAVLLSSCNFTLAQDVTPPPGYIPPTPAPTLLLVPPRTPDVANGAAIYAEKCLPCHGETGMGDGPQGIQLQGVTVPAFALPEVARPKSPAQWYTVVTRGNIERFMPPFASLTDQERWDVVAYITTLHTTDEQIQWGRELFEEKCTNCPTDFFKDQSKMASLSGVELARIVRLGNNEIKAFGESLSDEEMWAVAAYLRTLSFGSASPVASAQDAPTAVPVSKTPAPSDAGTPSAEETLTGTEQAAAENEATPVVRKGYGRISGSIENRTGAELLSDLAVTLHGYEHDFNNPSTPPQEVISLQASIASDGTFVFEDIEMPENRIFLAEVEYQGITQKSEFVIVRNGQNAISLPPLKLYGVSTDHSLLTVDELTMFFDASTETAYEVLALYTFRNPGDVIVSVAMENQQEIPFLKYPLNSQGFGYQAVQDSAPFVSIDGGFAMPPSEQPYGIIAISSIAREKSISFTQPLTLPVTIVRIFVPDGLELNGDQLTQDSPQTIQGAVYQSYLASHLNAGDSLTFTVSGSPRTSASPDAVSSTSNSLLIGAGALGLALILAGAWMYMRDRGRAAEAVEEDETENEFESAEDVMDAIIALDDLHRAKKISDETYHKRRAELKEELKEMM